MQAVESNYFRGATPLTCTNQTYNTMGHLMSDGRERPTAQTELQTVRSNRPGTVASNQQLSEAIKQQIAKAIENKKRISLIREYFSSNKKQANFYINKGFTFEDAKAHYLNKLANKLNG